eukprot:TRINITY_DN5563_c0_g1_i1.p1 TRINITY_DN5563_c0_g1~~TRINITY_DN5563_c0_g1_i1.p1  ORF type:complete len:662 (-),score=133.52 TRINITY_DN5563_c0_g1_i1:326-2311(-)
MVHFGKVFDQHKKLRWKSHYLDYEGLKRMIERDGKPKLGILGSPRSPRALRTPLLGDASFDNIINTEIACVKSFYFRKLQDCEEIFDEIKKDLQLYEQRQKTSKSDYRRTAEAIKASFRNLHKRLKELLDFRNINATAVTKICKKFDKQECNASCPISDIFVPQVSTDAFWNTQHVNQMRDEVLHLYSNCFCDGISIQAQSELSREHEHVHPWLVSRIFFKLGMIFALFVWFIWDCIMDANKSHGKCNFWKNDTFPVYRGIGCLLMLCWGWGTILYVLNRFRINYIFIYELGKRSQVNYHVIYRMASYGTLGFLLCILISNKICTANLSEKVIHQNTLSLGVFVGFLLMAVFPLNSSRRGLFKVLFETILSPFYDVRFKHSYVGDVLTSLVKVLVDLCYMCCYFFSGAFIHGTGEKTCTDAVWFKHWATPILIGLPLWFRFMQCIRRYIDTRKRFPNLANALKYAVALSVTAFGAFHPSSLKQQYNDGAWSMFHFLWIISYVGSTLYTFTWDVTQDWGLMRINKNNFLLRETLLYPRKWPYWCAIVVDLFLRFLWTTSLIPIASSNPLSSTLGNYLSPFLASAEIFRRCMWSIFRVENEHISNSSGYRRENFVPLHFEPEESEEDRIIKEKNGGRKFLFETSLFIGMVLFLVIYAAYTRDS